LQKVNGKEAGKSAYVLVDKGLLLVEIRLRLVISKRTGTGYELVLRTRLLIFLHRREATCFLIAIGATLIFHIWVIIRYSQNL